MKPLFFRPINADIATNCFQAIHDMVAKHQGKHAVTVEIGIDDKNARTIAQNRLYWLWLTELSKELGESKEYYHLYCKRNFLAKIYLRDGTDKRLSDTMPALQRAKMLLSEQDYEPIAWQVASGISSTSASNKQMSEYLNEIERFAVEKGINLPFPSELMWSVENGG